MKTYPLMLDIRGRTCVVVGAGAVGLRKVEALRSAGAKVRLVSSEALHDPPEGVEFIHADYAREHLAGALLVFACTDDRSVNARIAADARTSGALVNAADQPEDCDFFVPAAITDGEVVVAVGTGGSSPALAGQLKRLLAGHLPPRVGEFAAALSQVRRQLQAEQGELELRQAVQKALAGEEGYNVFVASGFAGLLELGRTLVRRKH